LNTSCAGAWPNALVQNNPAPATAARSPTRIAIVLSIVNGWVSNNRNRGSHYRDIGCKQEDQDLNMK
jgi:hypothetical protein